MFARTTRNYGDFHIINSSSRDGSKREDGKKRVFTPMLLFCRGKERKGNERNTSVTKYVKICKSPGTNIFAYYKVQYLFIRIHKRNSFLFFF